MASPDLAALSAAISILLGVLTYFLTLVREAGEAVLSKPIPDAAQQLARKDLRRQLSRVLFLAALPTGCGLLGLFYLCLPTALAVARESQIQLWDFDLARTLFVYLELGVGGCLGVSAMATGKLAAKLIRAR